MAQFRTKARAVELLGKGQIADLPTAISELWKNGYDAYATELGCTLYMQGFNDITSPIFTLSDNGFGMSENDILNKWIVLGTDSKARGTAFLSEEERFGLPMRVPMGEKGIGRLSVAYLGSPMLMITKKKSKPVQLLFVDWRILENYNLFVDDVIIPVEKCDSIADFSVIVDLLVDEFKRNFESEKSKIAWSEQKELFEQINNDIQNVSIPEALLKDSIERFFEYDYHGTTFVIFNPNEQLIELNDNNLDVQDGDSALEIQRSLSGIFNLFISEPDFETYFNILTGSGIRNIIKDFFEHDDFEKVDHYISGSFDENGLFTGTVRVYKEIIPLSYRPVRLPGKTPYGPFKFELGVVEGVQKSSCMLPEEWNIYDKKVEKFGALYIYRDFFRVLPYGKQEYDFLKFEERRSKHAGKYFFSHRRMFGYIGITRGQNPNLKDKAGREGFIENKAYKELKRDLIDFFNMLANEFFGTPDKNKQNARSRQQEEINAANNKIIDEEKKKNKQSKIKFNNDLRVFQEELIKLEEEINIKSEELYKRANMNSLSYEQYEEDSLSVNRYRTSLRKIKLYRPSRAILSPGQEKKFTSYQAQYEHVDKIIANCVSVIQEMRKRFSTENLQKDYEKKYVTSIKEIHHMISSYIDRFNIATDIIRNQLNNEQSFFVELFKSNLQDYITDLSSKESYQNAIDQITLISENIKDNIETRISSFINHVENLNLEIDDDVLVKWYKEEYEKLAVKLEATDALAQLGITVEIIDHELNSLYSQMATSLEMLNLYASTHTDVKPIYSPIKIAFDHMEANYKMLQPLYHNKRRMRTSFTGSLVLKDMKQFFSSKISKLNVDISCNNDFLDYSFNTYQSLIESVFINIINNALYWLIPVTDRKIYIEYDSEEDQILIMNNGEKMNDSILEDIFTLFYTKRREGRGIGLYLCRKNLRSEGLDIIASNDPKYNKLGGACFIIKTL